MTQTQISASSMSSDLMRRTGINDQSVFRLMAKYNLAPQDIEEMVTLKEDYGMGFPAMQTALNAGFNVYQLGELVSAIHTFKENEDIERETYMKDHMGPAPVSPPSFKTLVGFCGRFGIIPEDADNLVEMVIETCEEIGFPNQGFRSFNTVLRDVMQTAAREGIATLDATVELLSTPQMVPQQAEERHAEYL